MIARRRPVDVGIVALRRDDQQGSIHERTRDALQQLDDQHVGPLQVVDPQHDRAGPRAPTQPLDDQREQDLAGLRRRDVVEFGWIAEEMNHPFDGSAEHGVVGVEPVELESLGPTHLAEEFGRRVLVEVEAPEQRRGDRRPHVRLPVRCACPREDGDGPTRKRVERFGDEPGLAGTRFSRDRRDRTSAVGHHRHDRGEQFPLHRTAHERDVVEPGTDPRDSTPASRDPPHPNLLLSATNVERVDRLAEDLLGSERRGRVTDQDAAGLGQGLEARGDIDDVTHRGVLGGARHVADDDFAGVDADPQSERTVEVGLLVDEAGERFVHLQRGTDRSVGVVLMRHGRPEEREDPVSEHLVDAAAEGRDVGDQALEAGVDQTLDPLGIEVLGQRRVPDEIGEHDRDHPTLLGGGRRHLLTTGRAEPGAVRQRGVARGAGGHITRDRTARPPMDRPPWPRPVAESNSRFGCPRSTAG